MPEATLSEYVEEYMNFLRLRPVTPGVEECSHARKVCHDTVMEVTQVWIVSHFFGTF